MKKMPVSLMALCKAATVTVGLIAVLSLGACDAGKPKADDDGEAALRKAGYTPAPQITGVQQNGPSGFVITGQADPDGRVRFLYGQQRAIGVTADSKGRFRAELPAGPMGGLYDLSIEDTGRLLHAEGRLFIPPMHPTKAVLMRTGSPSQSLFNEGEALAVMDYDGAGAAAFSGRVAPRTQVNIILNGEIRARVTSDDKGFYSATGQMNAPSANPAIVTVGLQAGAIQANHQVPVSLPADADRVTAQGEGWRVDWALPGGGIQTTLVF